MIKTILASLVCCLLLVLIFSCIQGNYKPNPHEGMLPVDLEAIQLNDGWGFVISVNHKPYIRQEHIPLIYGLHAFASKEDALAVGKLMMRKMVKKGEMLPGLTMKELDSLHITIPK